MRYAYLLRILSSLSSSPTRFRLNIKVDQEEDGEESAQKYGKVGTELNLKGKSLGGKSLYDGVHCEGGGGDGRDRDGGKGSLLHVEAGFGDALGNWSGGERKNDEEESKCKWLDYSERNTGHTGVSMGC